MNASQLLAHFDRLAEAPNAVSRLRRFILDLAVLGKLVEQDTGDEPAVVLLKRIQAARLRVLKKSVKCSAAHATELDRADVQLPDGWAWSKLGDLCTKTGSGSTPAGGKDAYVGIGVPFLRSQNVYDDGLRLDGVAFISDATQARMSSTTVKAGDLLLNITGGSIGRCAIVPDSFVIGNINQHVAIIRLALLESGRFLHSVICSDYFQKHIFGNQTGAGREGLPKNRMDEILIPVAPLDEQHRIVTKVDELMALCDQLEAAQQERERRRDRLTAASLQRLNQPAADTTPEAQREHARFHLNHLPRLTTRPEQIKAMRQTILNLAVRGMLLNPAVDTEPAYVLLKRLQADIKSYGVQNRVQPAVVSAIPDGETPYPLPAGWIWTRLASLCRVVTDGDHLPPPKSMAGVAFLTIGNVSSGCLDFSNSRYVSQEYFDKITPYRRPEFGDLLYTVVGASYGRPVLVETDEPFCVQRHIAILKPAAELKLKYLHLLLRSPFVYNQATASLTGTAQPTIPLRPLRNFLIPLAPLAEQHRIVAKVDELMALCDQLEAEITTTQTDSCRLLEAVLQAALSPA